MHPQKLFFCLALCLASFLLSAQSADRPELRQRLDDYGRLTEALKIDSILDYMDPQLFELVPREMLAQQFEAVLDSSEMLITLGGFEYGDFGESVTTGAGEFLLVPYRGRIHMELRAEELRDSSAVAAMFSMMTASYGADKVDYDEAAYRFDIQLDKQLVAIRRPGATLWYFIEYQPQLGEMMEPILPREVRKALKLE